MKTWEMIKELTENPSKKFMCKSGPRKGRTVGFDGRSIDWHDEYRTNEFEKSYFSIKSTLNWEWEEVKEPVDFMAAVKSGKRFKLINKDDAEGVLTRYMDLNTFMDTLSSMWSKELSKAILTEGKFYIED